MSTHDPSLRTRAPHGKNHVATTDHPFCAAVRRIIVYIQSLQGFFLSDDFGLIEAVRSRGASPASGRARVKTSSPDHLVISLCELSTVSARTARLSRLQLSDTCAQQLSAAARDRKNFGRQRPVWYRRNRFSGDVSGAARACRSGRLDSGRTGSDRSFFTLAALYLLPPRAPAPHPIHFRAHSLSAGDALQRIAAALSPHRPDL